MAYEILSATLSGIDARPVRVQIDGNPGIHSFSIVGLADKAVQESADRLDAAIKHGGFVPPRAKNRRFVVNLAPADLPKVGTGLDGAIALAYLLESRQIQASSVQRLIYAEVGLDGKFNHTSGVLAVAMLARELNCEEILVPLANAPEAAFVRGIRVIGAEGIADMAAHISGEKLLPPALEAQDAPPAYADDSWSHIRGQFAAKRAVVVAAAGGHNLLMSGTPGSGKTLLARSLVGLLPPLARQEALEVAKIQSSVGLLRGPVNALPRPFCAPHHTASPAAIVGGGTHIRPGQISLAHRGVLFLDELPEFARNVLESLRQPLEDGVVTVSRASGSASLPAKFMLVGAMNPCPCGNLGDANTLCSCGPTTVARYAKRLSGPLLDRMDIQVHVSRERIDATPPKAEDIGKAREAIAQARERQLQRLAPVGLITNSEISHRTVDTLCKLEGTAEHLLSSLVNQKGLSLRAYHKIKKIGRTIADLEGSERIGERHIAEAMMLRIADRVTVGLT